MKKLLPVTLLILPGLSLATDLGIRISDDAVSLKAGSGINQSNSSFDASWIHNDSKDRDVINAGLYVNGDDSAGVHGRMGAKLYWGDVDFADGYGMALGGQVIFDLNYKLSLMADVYWGPGSLAFNDIDGYMEWSAGLGFEPFENGKISVGYKYLDLDTNTKEDVSVDNGLFLGMQLTFE